jgi:hypothetical protein
MFQRVRIEFEGALYHIMCRGDPREEIFRDEQDRELFLSTLSACLQGLTLLHLPLPASPSRSFLSTFRLIASWLGLSSLAVAPVAAIDPLFATLHVEVQPGFVELAPA